MENRRPPRFNSSGRKPYFDQGRSAPYRSGPASGEGRGKGPGRPVRGGDGRRDSTDRTGGPRRGDGNRYGQGRSDGRSVDGRSRTSAAGKHGRFENEIKITSDAQ